eukprot:TRINITY_DN91986_c0_g1_i1.p1 TRINITY_DN91986_c0_g1~~TRINITY_DN91986_c0_g1_i1.p1  ORF type:complete len:611 (+),score=81.62 TRINITY_DN91986_c0_g1_i1:96-1835(+)
MADEVTLQVPRLSNASSTIGGGEACLGTVMKPLLEQAIRESLKELARNAVQADLDSGSPRSIEGIVKDVAGRVLEEAGPGLVDALQCQDVVSNGTGAGGYSPACKRELAAPDPLLQDLTCTPWRLWRELGQSDSVQPRTTSLPQSPNPGSSDPDWFRASPDPCEFAVCLGAQPTALRPEGSTEVDRSAKKAPPRLTIQPSKWLESLDSGASSDSAEPMNKSSPRGLVTGSTTFEQPLVVREGLTIDSNSEQHLHMQWQQRPQQVLIVAKPGDRLVNATLQDMTAWLSSQSITVILEPKLLAKLPQLRRSSQRGIRTFSKADELEKRVDLVITIGGDGTLTWAVSLFRNAMPPVLSFAAGSLGFLTPYPLDTWVRTLTKLLDLHRIHRPLSLVCRMRLMITVRRRGMADPGGTPSGSCEDDKVFQVQSLNEVLVHRGNSGQLCKLDVCVDGERVTLVQGDGLILATPTGSTAYSLAAGGSMVHPSVPAILLTPVSPHSLSFRPAVLPDSAVITVGVPLMARSGAALSIDGKDICSLHLGDSIEVSMSPHPVPTICRTTETGDWFGSVHAALQWNRRDEQK